MFTVSIALSLAQINSAPTVSYSRVTGRNLIAINNPEQLTTDDLADSNFGSKVIYRQLLRPGSYRNWFEHVNRSGGTIGYAVSLRNIARNVATFRIRGRAFDVGLLGGKCFSDLLSNYATGTTVNISPGSTVWIWRNDNAVTNTNFFSGVIDFELTGGSIEIDNIAYRNFANIAKGRTYMGYITRVEPDGTRCARQYKGIAPVTTVQTNLLAFTINDLNTGALTVTTSDYNLTTQTYGNPTQRTFWFTNIGPGQNTQAVTSDMLSWDMPGWGLVNPLTRSDATNNFPNLGNWAVEYSVRGSVSNEGTRSRTISINLQAPAGGGSPIAYRGGDGVWRHLKINAGSNIQYFTLAIPAGQTRSFDARYILGGPGAGSLRNTITLIN